MIPLRLESVKTSDAFKNIRADFLEFFLIERLSAKLKGHYTYTYMDI